MPEIVDRRNELAGNLALDQEINSIEKINELRRRARGSQTLPAHRNPPGRAVLDLDYPSKLDRGARHIQRLIATGREGGGGASSLPYFMGKAQVTELTEKVGGAS